MKSYTNPLRTGALGRLIVRLRQGRDTGNGSPPTATPAAPPRKPLRAWRIAGRIFHAHTKSEARAQAKRINGLDRLPAGTVIEEVKPEAAAA